MKVIHWILQLLFPPKCILCKKVLGKEETDLCYNCRVEAPAYPNGKRKIQFLDSFTAVWYYEGNVRKSLLRYKFYGARKNADSYGRLLAMRLLETNPDGFDCLTWVPVSRLRKFRRGYDQSALLAKALGKELGIQPVPTLKKIRNNKTQSSLQGSAQRRANVLGAYRVINADAVRGKRILLVDDVFTTGATAGECARMLLTAGAKEVHCAAIAAARK